ncbi:unnamed protein product, partial [Staurois parvus]
SSGKTRRGTESLARLRAPSRLARPAGPESSGKPGTESSGKTAGTSQLAVTAGFECRLARLRAPPSRLAEQRARVNRHDSGHRVHSGIGLSGLDSGHRVTRYDSGHWVTRHRQWAPGPPGMTAG